jgi:ribonuclease BN (tRNA processing enzyme)
VKQFREAIVSHPLDIKTDFPSSGHDVVCLSHLRWDFVYQRPQHLLNRCGQKRRVFFIEAPVIEFVDSWWLEISQASVGYGLWCRISPIGCVMN